MTLIIPIFVLAMTNTFQTDHTETRRSDFKETLHGREMADPYRWLEDANSDETKAWVQAQNKVTFDYLANLPDRKAIAKRFEELYNFEKFGTPSYIAGKYFWNYNSGLQNQDVIYWAKKISGEKKVLIDPNTLSNNGTVALSGMSISDDGKRLAYAVSRGGSDWKEWYVRDIETSKDLEDHIEWSKFSDASWDHQGNGFYYSRYDAPKVGTALQEQNFYQKLYYHRVGDHQANDKLIYERKNQKEWGIGGTVTEDGRFLVLPIWKGTNRENQIFYKDFNDKSGKVVELIAGFDAQYTFLGNFGHIFYFQTDKNAPLGKVISIDVREPMNRKEVIPQSKQALEGVSMTGGRLFANYLKDAYTQIKVYDLSGHFERDVKMPGIGTGGGFDGRRDDRFTFYSYASFDTPTTIYRYDIDSGKSEKIFQPKVKFDPSKFETKQVFYKSADGTRIPMFISHKKGLKLDGTNPTLLYGYGGFSSAMTPFFSPSRLLWMEAGGVSAVACIRGGSEYGKAWHDGGKLFKKMNCFQDFISAGEYLIEKKYTSKPRLAIQGGSNGGLLVGACMNLRPDLFAVCLPEVGVMDMLRFHKFTIGWAWTSDYGSPDKKKDFEYLLKYSPLHNLKLGTKYPATLIITGDHDDRVVPAHSFKYAAQLQYCQSGDAPVMIRIETQAGHGAGKPTTKIIEEIADKWAFALHNLAYKLPSGFGR